MPLTLPGLVAEYPAIRIGIRVSPLTVAAAVLAAHFVLHAVPTDIATRDDADQFLFGQQLALGYHEQPPLYSWLVWVAFQLGGRTMVAYAAAKTVVLGVLFLAAWAAAKEAVVEPRWRLVAAAGAVFLPSLAWHVLTYLTHSNLLLAACYATVAAALRLGRLGRTRDYLVLGLIAGLGALAKYNYGHFAAALVLAGLTLPTFRARLLDRRMLLTVAVAGLVFLPHTVWLAGHWNDVWPALAGKVSSDLNRSEVARVTAAVGQLPLNVLLLVAPLLLYAHGIAPESLRRSVADPEASRLLRRAFAAGVLMLAPLAVGGAGRMHERWLVPLAVFLPLAVFARAVRSPRRGELAVLTLSLLLVAGQTLQVATDDDAPFPATDAAALETVAAAAGPAGVIVAETREMAGAFAYRFPDRRVLCEKLPAYRPWPTDQGVWVGTTDDNRPASVAESPAPRMPGGSLRLIYRPLGGERRDVSPPVNAPPAG